MRYSPETIRKISDRCVAHVFSMMINPRYRGTSFSFKTFDIEDHAAGICGMSFRRRLTAEEDALLRNYARMAWDTAVKNSGVLEWLEPTPSASSSTASGTP